MRTLFPRRPSPAMIVACIALLVALGGTSIAAVNALPRRSVGTPQLKNNAVTSIKVKNRSLRAVDFARGQLPVGPAGPEGPQGATGERGAKGAKGDPGSSRAWARVNGDGTITSDANVTNVSGSTGLYCVFVENVDASKAGAVVTPIGGTVDRRFAIALPGGCGPSASPAFQVAIWGADGKLVASPFTIVVP